MSRYIFIAGKDPELSLAELYAVYPDALFDHVEANFIVMETPKKLTQNDFSRLGGVIKMAKIESEVVRNDLSEGVIEALLKNHESGKLNYAVSVYGMPENMLRKLLISLKKLLKSAGVSSRFANQNFQNLSVAQKKGLKGPEIVVAELKSQYAIAEVIATQDIDAYSQRDFHKPFRSMKVGMLPPKLAQILINLTGSTGAVWDPFCGGGVLLMEGLLSGHDMLGSDINTETLVGAQKNIDWLNQVCGLSKKASLFEHDATDSVPDHIFEAIAFEGYLGPPQTHSRGERELRPIAHELDQLYTRFFSQLKAAGFKGSIVAALPFFRLRDGSEMGLDCVERIEEMGFELQSLLPHQKCFSLNYARDDQLVGREVLKFLLKI